MPFTKAELYVLRDFNTLTDDEAYQTAFRLLESELTMCAKLPIPPQHVLALHEWIDGPSAILLFDLYCYGLHYAVQIIGAHLVRVSEIDMRNRRERITWSDKKRASHDYPFPSVSLVPSD